MSKKQSVHVIGAGLIGLDISLRYRMSLKANQESSSITVHDQGTNILGSWSSKVCSGYQINNGFHGIEMPRARLTVDFLGHCGCASSLVEIPNNRLLCIEGEQVFFNTSIAEWPKYLSEGLFPILDECSSIDQPENLMDKVLASTFIGGSISRNYNRFSSAFKHSWHLFFPWFFPSEFTFTGSDEGGQFQNMVRNKSINSSYVIPKMLLFESLRIPMMQHLQSQHIDLSLDSSLSRDDLEYLCSSDSKRILWCASAFGLLKTVDQSLAKKCILEARHMQIALYSISGKSICAWKDNLGRLPSEILYLDSDSPELNRLSFLDYQACMKNEISSDVIVMVEYFTIEKNPSDLILSKIKVSLEKQFSSKINFIGNAYGRPTYVLDDEFVDSATEVVQSYAVDNGIEIPCIYFGPINMAKCAKIASEFDLRI